jgi:hypothetical protein
MADDKIKCEYCRKSADYMIKSHGESGLEIAACHEHHSKALSEVGNEANLDILVLEGDRWVKDEAETKQVRYEHVLSHPATSTPSEARGWMERNGL